MDGLSGIGTNPYLRSQSGAGVTETAASRSAPAFVAADMPTRANTSLGGMTQTPVEGSLLVALQDVRLNNPAAEDEAEEGETESAGIFATGEEDETETVIDEILEKGFVDWAHEEWLERIREEARKTVMAGMGLTEDDVASMSPDMQDQVERLIKEAVDEAVSRAVEKAAEENGEKTSGQAMVVSPIITGA
ncbi:hypothetical protein [Shumkonia mesophila]|uniref:hypothetical protein n=1 Tax=Shumkonia mesophila TaxID=2838854 RepID=UPI00293472DD|nr:hypothetical protein [Shumkonia mesophila]